MVDTVHVVRPVVPCEVIEGLTFAMDPTHFVIEVLVGAALPRVIRLGNRQALECLGDRCALCEFAAVIDRNGLDRILQGSHHGDDGVSHHKTPRNRKGTTTQLVFTDLQFRGIVGLGEGSTRH